MNRRIYIDREHRDAYKAAVRWAEATGVAAAETGLDRRLIELVNLRVSQINRCAACLNMHLKKALAEGETVQRIAVLPAWRHADLYSPAERAALGLAESLTNLPSEAEQDAAYAEASEVLTTDQLSAVSWVVVAINAFNRISIVSQHPVRSAAR